MQYNEKQALNKAMVICSKSEKCISDIEKKLQQWEISEQVSCRIIDQLVAQKFIDEERFSHFYVRDKFRFNNWGRKKITFMLKGKGISNTDIADALTEIEEEEYMQKLKTLLADKSKRIKTENEYDKKAKLIRFAQGRGFEYDLIQKVLAQI